MSLWWPRLGGVEGGRKEGHPPDLNDLPSLIPLTDLLLTLPHRHISDFGTYQYTEYCTTVVGPSWPDVAWITGWGRVDCRGGPLRKRICSVNLGPAVTVTEEQGTKGLIPARLGLATSNTTCIYSTDVFP
ncbi:hypothetical protein E2C01_004801 [Portunus trituberculatus]|uniref:Uncharacterized protein n=1 Tax=Portunus trituberculatus TaxID=210409 RepID=A0A5B7CTZ2_PORTR|nr:hypothetical protein [Portunus trituberculatus]